MVQWWNKRSLAVGKPTTGPKKAFTGDHVYATNLDSPYENQTDAHLSMPMIAVPESGSSFYNINTGMTLKQIMTMCIFMCSLRGRCCPSGSLHRQNKWMDKRRSRFICLQRSERESYFSAKNGWQCNKRRFYLDDVKITDQALPQKAKKQLGVIKKKSQHRSRRNLSIRKAQSLLK